MYEYAVRTSFVRDSEEIMNEMAADGWRVAAVCVNQAMGFGLVITFERKVG